MRALLVGPARARERLRGDLEAHGIEIAGEFETSLEADASAIHADMTILTPPPSSAMAEVFEEPLTRREQEVLELLAEGLPNKGIADRLGISDQTVKFHVASIMGKLGTGNRVETVRRAVRRGLLTI